MYFFHSAIHSPLKYISCGKLENSDGFLHRARCLNTFVILVGLEGKLYLMEDENKYILEPGQFMLLQPGRKHRGYKKSEGLVSYYWCHFSVDDNYQLLDEPDAIPMLNKSASDILNSRDIYFLPTHGNISNNSLILLEYRQLIDFSQQVLYSSAIMDYALSLLMMSLTQEMLSGSTANTSFRSFSSRMEILEYIRLNYRRNIRVPEIAHKFGYNANYLSTVFKKTFNISISQYINQMRISAAKTMLLNTNESLETIATQVGYNDDKYFIRIFKQLEGLTPIQYRNVYFRSHINRE